MTRLTSPPSYPSLLESSDIDGGSSVAVLTYLRHILESIDHPDLVRLTLQYLFGLQESLADVGIPHTPANLARRRKSQNLFSRLAKEKNQLSPDLFNLSDLIMASLRSKSQQTITATLLILSAMLCRAHHRGLTTLLKTRPAQPSERQRSVGGQEKEVDQMLSLAENITAFQDLETSYEQYLYDDRNMLESHPCSIQFLSLPVSNAKVLFKEASEEGPSHRILTLEDPTFKSLLSLLDHFFENDIETNLSLTQVIVDLASCPYMRLEGWLLTSPSAYTFPPLPSPLLTSSPTDSQLREIMLHRRHPNHPATSSSPILQTLTRLTRTIDTTFRRTIPSFDSHILSCRSIIYPELLSTTSSLPSSRSPSRPAPQPNFQANPQATPIPPRLRAPDTSSRSSTPSRGRQLDTLSRDRSTVSSTLATRLSSMQGRSSSPSPSKGMSSPSRRQEVEHSRSPYRDYARVGAATPQKAMPRQIMVPPALQQRVRVSSRVGNAYRKRDGDHSNGSSNKEKQAADEESESESARLGSEDGGGLEKEDEEDEEDEEEEDGRIGRAKTRKGPSPGGGGGGGGGDGGRRKIIATRSVHGDVDRPTAANGDSAREEEEEEEGTVTLGHLCTNVVILQEFILELAAVVQVRAGLFGEVEYL